MGVNSLPKTVTRQRRGCDLNPGPSEPELQHANHSATEPPSSSIIIIIVKKLKTPRKDDCRYVKQLKQRISKRCYYCYFAAHRRVSNV